MCSKTKNNDWLKFLQNKRIIQSIYSEDLPSLNSFRIRMVTIDHLRDRLQLAGDLAQYPSSPPKKWVANLFNTAHIVIEMVNINKFEYGIFSKEMTVDIKLQETKFGVELSTTSGLICESEILDVVDISGYTDSIIP